jgi:hypothetical protein
VYAQPLGATNLAAIVRRADIQPLVELDGLLAEARGLNANSERQWTQFLQSIEVDRVELSQATNDAFEAKLSNLSHREKDWLVERFLWIAATTDARRKGLFDLAKMDETKREGVAARLLTLLKRGGVPPIVGRQLRNGDMVLANRQVSHYLWCIPRFVFPAKEESFSHAPL